LLLPKEAKQATGLILFHPLGEATNKRIVYAPEA